MKKSWKNLNILTLIKKIVVIIFLITLSKVIFAAELHTKQWTVSTIIGSFSQNQKIKYYLEPQVRLIDDKYVFNQFFFLAGFGYQLTPAMVLFLGPSWILTKNTEGKIYHEYRLWEQLNWQLINNSSILLNSRSRFEEKERSNQQQIAIQFRERLWARIPIKNIPLYYYSFFDEVFFNFNHPSWVSPYFFEQNRMFLGIAKQLTKTMMLDFGYLNQLQLGPPCQIDNVILLSVSITF